MSGDPYISCLYNLIYAINFDGESIFTGVLLVILLFLSAVFSATETSYSSLNIIRIKNLAKTNRKGAKKAKRVYALNKKYSQVIATILILNNLVNLAASAVVTYLFSVKLGLGPNGVLLATVLISILVITFGEIIPKNFAKLYPEKMAYWMAIPLKIMTIVFYPITILFAKVSDRMEEKVENEDERVTATEDELIEIVDTIEKEGVLEQTESEIIKSAINFDDKTISSCMIDKSKVLYVDDSIDFESLIKVIRESPFSRIPVLSKVKNQVIGIVRQRDVFDVLARNDENYKYNLSKLMRAANVVSYRRVLPYALEKMQRQKAHMLIVVDNIRDKDFMGILTLEDVLEEIVGEIYDEGDKLPKGVVEIGHHIFEVSGDVLLEDFFDDYLDDTDYPRTKFKTVGEWTRRLARNIIKIGKVVKYDNITIKITKIEEGLIKAVEVEQFTKQDEDDEDE
ncbi:MAG: hemolysin family protein [Bacilli bacterium]|nr:hemolysin family protein [Bacilli bacterium]